MYVRELDGKAIRLGVSGRLWRDALVMYDRTTGSFWSQIDGRAIVGRAEGNRLAELPATVTSWGDWKHRHPDTLVLKPDKWSMKGGNYGDYHSRPGQLGILESSNVDTRMTGKYLVYGFTDGERSGAIKVQMLADRGWVETKLGSTPVLLVLVGGEDGRAYSRRVGSRTLTFVRDANGTLKDRETATTWNPETGTATAGPLEGQLLRRIEGRRAYWFIWAAFHPGTAIVEDRHP